MGRWKWNITWFGFVENNPNQMLMVETIARKLEGSDSKVDWRMDSEIPLKYDINGISTKNTIIVVLENHKDWLWRFGRKDI